MEILSPAGSPEGLAASVKGGCDAVYLGGKAFGARAFSDNFTDAELEGAVNYAHNNGVKVYVTVNTLIKDSEMADAVSYVKFLKDIHADAILIQDLGLLKAIKNIDIDKHASTQMGIHSASGLEWCAENDISRAVLSRELTFEELTKIVKDSPIETEVFVQGAMCYCVSGGCLFSSIVGGRSGNRGQCAQPCRKTYTKNGKEGYLLSSADLYGVEWLDRLRSIGISAVKIEGRMRSHAYAYLSTKVFSSANKGIIETETADLLKTVFNRGFCEGYLPGVISPVQYKYADNRGFLLGETKIVNRKLDLSDLDEIVSLKDGISIFKGKDKIGGFKVNGLGTVTVPFKMPDGKYEIYRTYDPRIDTIKNLVGAPPKLSGSKARTPILRTLPDVKRSAKKPELSFYVSSLKNLDAVKKYADRVYFDINEHSREAQRICTENNVEFVLNLPRFSPSDDLDIHSESVMVNNPGQSYANKERKIFGSHYMNLFNSDFPSLMYQTTASLELSKNETRILSEHYPGRIEVMVFGRTEIMCTRDPNMNGGILIDDTERQFPVYKDAFGLSHILNSSDLMLLSYLDDLRHMGIDSFGIDLRKRPTRLAEIVAEAFAKNDLDKKGKITEMCGAINYGHYLRGVS
jgi:Collagenase and related proteases